MTARARTLLTPAAERDLLDRARSGESRAASQLFARVQPALRDVVRRLVAQPDDTDDQVQETLVEGFEALAGEPVANGERFADTLEAAAVKHAMLFLAERRNWRVSAQVEAQAAVDEQDLLEPLLEILHDEDFQFDVREHVAFCFACVSRALPLEQHVAVTLVDVLGLDLPRAAALTQATEEQIGKFVNEGRETLRGWYDQMCRLVSDTGSCDQCRGLRDAAPGNRKGPEIDGPGGIVRDLMDPIPEARLTARTRMVRAANLDAGVTKKLHDELFRLIERTEQNRTTPAKKDHEVPGGKHRFENLQDRNN